MAKLVSISAAEPGWKALFLSDDGEESQSRVVSWALTDGGEVVGLVVHPDERRQIVPVTELVLADGSTFDRYGHRPG